MRTASKPSSRITVRRAARHAQGLTPLSSFYDQALSVERILVLSSGAFDYAAPLVPDNVRYVGPILDEPDWAQPWTAPWPASDQRRLVLVGFSSTFQNQGPLLRRVVEALSALPVRGVVTVGQMLDTGEVTATGNVVVVGSSPHRQILAEASLAVSHRGQGTTMKTLAAGVPVVCVRWVVTSPTRRRRPRHRRPRDGARVPGRWPGRAHRSVSNQPTTRIQPPSQEG